jgi:hypothetical protein
VSAGNGGPAFPCDSKRFESEGMTLRDYFAAKAMSAIISKSPLGVCFQVDDPEEFMAIQNAIARGAFDYADAMLAARENGGEPEQHSGAGA